MGPKATVAAVISLCFAVSAATARAAWTPEPPSVKQARYPRAVSVFPLPGTQVASPESEISFRGLPERMIGRVRVVGSVSGKHPGSFVAHRDGEGASFVPTEPFAPGERVTVTSVGARLRIRGAVDGRYTFTVARPVADVTPPSPPAVTAPTLTFATEPALLIGAVNLTVPTAPGVAPGDVFLAPRRGAGQNGLEILDDTGAPVWFQPLPDGLQATDFREQTYHGRPVLTWWQGTLSTGHGSGEGEIVDESYRPVATVTAGDGYQADLHDFQLTAAGTALVTAYQPVHWNLTSVGGPADGIVLDCVVQEVEVGTGRVLFEWHSLGNVPLTDTYASVPADPSVPFDYFHVNAVSSDAAGDLLVSSRATHTIYEIDGLTGRIHWRLGGKRSDFALGAGASFHSQHDAKWIDATTMSIFDNGAGVGGDPEPMSRAIVLHIDRAQRTATLISAFAQPQGFLFPSQGDIQPLPNGDWFVGWGQGPYATEFAPDGSVVFGLKLDSGSSYRAYRFEWHGRPGTPPDVVATRNGGETDVAVSWNGATDVARWEVLAGSSPDALAVVTSAPRAGFETDIAAPTTAAYVAVRALDAAGTELGESPATAVHP